MSHTNPFLGKYKQTITQVISVTQTEIFHFQKINSNAHFSVFLSFFFFLKTFKLAAGGSLSQNASLTIALLTRRTYHTIINNMDILIYSEAIIRLIDEQ